MEGYVREVVGQREQMSRGLLDGETRFTSGEAFVLAETGNNCWRSLASLEPSSTSSRLSSHTLSF